MINRYIPYGYYVQDAAIKINETEADVIRSLFRRYISGASIKELASELTRAGSEYLPGRSKWDPNRVYRLLRNEKYAGRNGFPSIISETQFQKAQAVRDERNTYQKSPEGTTAITEAAAPILCGMCGQTARRRRGRSGKGRQRYVCENPDCQKEYLIPDEKMTSLALGALQAAKIRLPICQKSSLEIRKAENEIVRLLDSPDADPKEIRCRIFDLAAEKYKLLTAGLVITDKLRAALAPANLSSSNIRKTVMETVKLIKLIDDDSIELTLINDQTVREVPPNGTGPTAKVGAGDPADNPAGAGEGIA